MSAVGSSSDNQKFVVYSFSGSKEKFQEWKIKTLSLSRVHKVHRFLTQKVALPTEQEAEVKGENSTEYKTYESNVKAYDLLVRSCTGVPLSLIESVEDGNAYEAWQKLLSKYETKKEDVQALEESWNGCKLEGMSIDPVEWFLKLDRINRLLESIDVKYKKDEVQLAGHILNNVGKDYAAVVTSIEASGNTKDVDMIKDAIERHWKKNRSSSGKGLSEAFVAESKFTGTCNYCKKPNHKWKDCFKRKADLKKKDEGGRTAGAGNKGTVGGAMKCWLCGGPHAKKECSKYKGGKGKEVHTVYEEGMFLCEAVSVTPAPTYKEVLLMQHEVNTITPVAINYDADSESVEEEEEDVINNEEVDDEIDDLIELAFCQRIDNA